MLAGSLWIHADATAAGNEDATLLVDFERLLAQGCDPAGFGIATALQARALRNLPYARAGLRFRAAELAALYRQDGDWYRPRTEQVKIEAQELACVQRLQQHERKLRHQLPIEDAVESVLIAQLQVYQWLRDHLRYPNHYRGAYSAQQPGSWTWGFQDGAQCGGDGNPESAEDCAAYSVICTQTTNEDPNAAPSCEFIQAG